MLFRRAPSRSHNGAYCFFKTLFVRFIRRIKSINLYLLQMKKDMNNEPFSLFGKLLYCAVLSIFIIGIILKIVMFKAIGA